MPLELSTVLMAFASNAQNLVVELLSGIFLECLPEDGLAITELNEAPLNVSQVCRHWRNVSLSTHRLWAGVYLWCATDEAALEYALPALRVFLQRSEGISFHVKIECPKENSDADFPTLHARDRLLVNWPPIHVVMQELAVCSERVNEIVLSLSDALSESALMYTINNFRSLGRLSLHFHSYGTGEFTSLDGAFWNAAYQLVSLDLMCTIHVALNANDIVPFPRLQHLTLYLVNEMLLLHLLNACPTLVSFRFCPYRHVAVSSTNHFADLASRMTLPSLRILEVEETDMFHELPFLFRSIRTPQLRRLNIGDTDGRFGSDLEAFLVESRPPLKELFLIRGELEEECIIRILNLLPGLRKLRIRSSLRILRALVLPISCGTSGAREGAYPLLEKLTLDVEGMSFEDSAQIWSAAEGMVRSRWETRKMRTTGPAKANKSTATPDLVAPNPRKLRRIKLLHIKKEHWENLQLNQCIKDCESQGLVINLEGYL